jgi:hypothetical protein
MKNTRGRERRRQQTTADIIQQVRNAVQDELAGAPASFGLEELEGIEESVITNTQRVVAGLSIEAMESEAALSLHVANARLETNHRINERRPSSGGCVMKMEFDPLLAFPADELVHLTVALPITFVAAIDVALEGLPFVKNRERFVAFAVLFALSDIHADAAAVPDHS